MPCIDFFHALSDETRLRIVRVLALAPAPLCVAEIVDIVRRPQYAVSRALGTLARAGLLTQEDRGRLRFYTVAHTDVSRALVAAVDAVASAEGACAWPVDVDRLRWRMDLRADGECVVTYTAGYSPPAYRSQEEEMDSTEKRRMLFVCVHNSARSQMAEAYLRHYGGDIFDVESAGLTPGRLNPYVVRVMAEDGYDIAHKQTQSVHDLYRAGHTYTYVVTVCSREAEEGCPIFPGPVRRLSWPFDDPSTFTGTDEEILTQTRRVRDEIKTTIEQFVTTYREEHHR